VPFARGPPGLGICSACRTLVRTTCRRGAIACSKNGRARAGRR
jgi:hypothetical protein